MATNKTDRAFKTLINKLTTDEDKRAFEELGADTINVNADEIWAEPPQFDDPTTAIGDGRAELRTLFVLEEDVSVPNQQTWIAEDTGVRLSDWISDKYGPLYTAKLYDGLDQQIFPTDASDWFFDYHTGVVTFSGSTAGFSKPFKITGYRYVGPKGVDTSGAAQDVQDNLDDHLADLANPHVVTAAQAGADPVGSAGAVQGNLDTHEADLANPHAVTAVQAGADPVGSAGAVQGNLDTHEADLANPHAVTAVQAGADLVGSAAAVQTNLDTHEGDLANPHVVTAAQAGADPVGSAAGVQTNLDTHEGDLANPHEVTAAQAGADPSGSASTVQGNLDTHTGDMANPHGVTAVQASAVPSSEKGAANGVATLDAFGKVETGQLPALAITDTFTVGSEAAMLALTAETGDVAIRTDLPDTFILQGTDPSVLGDWAKLEHPTDVVTSVQGDTGVVTLDTDDIPEGSVNEYYTDGKVAAQTDVAANTAARHGHANKAELDLVTDGDHDVRTDNPHAVTADQVEMDVVGTPTFTNVQHMQDIFHSTGWSSGGVMTDIGGANVQVTAGTGFIRALNDQLDPLKFFDWPQAIHNIPADVVRYIGVEYNGGNPIVSIRTASTWDLQTAFPLGLVVNEGGVLHIETDPQAVGDHAGNMIQRMLETQTVRRDNILGGLLLGETGTRNVTLSEGALWKRLNRFPIAALDTSGADIFDAYYSNGFGGWTKQASQTQWNNANYDDGDGTPGVIQAGYYGVQWFYLELDGELVMMYGTDEYISQAAAELATAPAAAPNRVTYHATLIGRLIFQEGASTAAAIQTVFEQSFQASPVTDHQQLSNRGDVAAHSQYQLGSEKSAVNGYASLDGTGKVPLAELPPLGGGGGGSGWIRITDVEVQPSAGGSESDHVYQDPTYETILQSLTVSDGQIRVHVEASYPLVDVDGNAVELQKVGTIYSGFVDFTHPTSGDVVAEVSTPDDDPGATDTVDVTIEAPPVVTAASFTGSYPGSQTELKENDNFSVSVTADKLFDRLRVLNWEACKLEEFVVSPAAFTTIKAATIDDSGDTAVLRPARVQVRDSVTGAWSDTFDTGVQGVGVDGTNTVLCNDAGINVAYGAKGYPGTQEALKNSENATIGSTVSAPGGLAAADTVDWDSPSAQLSITNPNETGPTFDASKTVQRISGNYNISSNNLRATCNRDANDKTTVFQTNIAIAHVAPTITVLEAATRLRSGGNDSTSEQLHTITIQSNQQLHSTASPSVDPLAGGGRATRGIFQGSWTGGPSSWTRSLGVHDDDGKGTFAWQNLSGVLNKAEIPVTVISGDSNYVLGGFVQRDVYFAPFTANGNATVQAVDFSKLTAASFTNGNPGVKQPIGTPDTTDVGKEGWWTIIAIGVNPTVVHMLHSPTVAANSGGIYLQDVEETV